MQRILSLVLALWQLHCTQSFATYLLSRSNCWTDLSTDEIIMNYRVVSHEESDDPQMHIQLVEGGVVNPLPAGTTFPTKVALQVVTENTATHRDYQFVMQVNGTGASFVGGSCEEDRRIAGRAREIVELMLQNPVPVTVWAGWATGHEHVRLTPELILLPPVEEEEEHATLGEDNPDRKEDEHGTMEWHEQLLHACSSIDWASLTTFAGRTIEHSDSAEIYMDGTVENPRVALRNADFETLVIHCTDGAQVSSSTSSTCPHMAVISASEEWPFLELQEERNIYISGLYSLTGNPTTLYRTNALELEWTPPAGDEGEPVEETARSREEENAARIRDKETPGIIQEKAEILERVQGHAKQIERDREAVQKRGDRWKASTTGQDTPKKPKATPEKPFDHVVVVVNEDIATNGQDPVVFTVGPHYYIGMAIMIGVGLIATQFCLCSSRKDKGRRDL